MLLIPCHSALRESRPLRDICMSDRNLADHVLLCLFQVGSDLICIFCALSHEKKNRFLIRLPEIFSTFMPFGVSKVDMLFPLGGASKRRPSE